MGLILVTNLSIFIYLFILLNEKVDTAGIDGIRWMNDILEKDMGHLVLSNLSPLVYERLHGADVISEIGHQYIFDNIYQALHFCEVFLKIIIKKIKNKYIK